MEEIEAMSKDDWKEPIKNLRNYNRIILKFIIVEKLFDYEKRKQRMKKIFPTISNSGIQRRIFFPCKVISFVFNRNEFRQFFRNENSNFFITVFRACLNFIELFKLNDFSYSYLLFCVLFSVFCTFIFCFSPLKLQNQSTKSI